ncbi:MAG: NUDIX domain-containing protein [Treponema sp.]|nr:NUDIX domain-containing protein [Treponema sp.]
MFKYCPSCSSEKIIFNEGKVFRCPDCGFTYYHNIAAATGCIISVPEGDSSTESSRGERLVFLVRGKEPAIGKLDLPGGFVDIGEGVLEGLYRELREEIGWTPPVPAGRDGLASIFKLFASFPNIYEYKGIKYNTCDLYFSMNAPGLTLEDLRLEQSEIAAVHFLKQEEIDFDQFAFESTRQAVKLYLNIP